MQKMNQLKQKHIVRFLTAFRRGHRGEEDHYLMLEWASGGNLRNLWKTFPRPKLTQGLIKAAILQIHGLAEAICMAHYPALGTEASKSYLTFRHGDLKPENILWFKQKKGGPHDIGTLKIGDWGLAKQQNILTQFRTNKTSTEWGTRRYEPPEETTADTVGLQPKAPSKSKDPSKSKGPLKRRSRLYDIWAMGCITLEFLIWLMYGPDGLDRFNESISTGSDNVTFYQVANSTPPTAKVHDAAVTWMNHMAKDPACKVGETALGNLLELIRDSLLVVKLPARMATSVSESNSFTARAPTLRLKSDLDITLPKDSLDPTPLKEQNNNPAIVVTKPEAETPKRETSPRPNRQAPKRKLGEVRVQERALGHYFRDQMFIILDDDESFVSGYRNYWFNGEPGPPPAHSTDDSKTQDAAQKENILPRGNRGDNKSAHGGGLSVMQTGQVSISPVTSSYSVHVFN